MCVFRFIHDRFVMWIVITSLLAMYFLSFILNWQCRGARSILSLRIKRVTIFDVYYECERYSNLISKNLITLFKFIIVCKKIIGFMPLEAYFSYKFLFHSEHIVEVIFFFFCVSKNVLHKGFHLTEYKIKTNCLTTFFGVL